MGLAASRVAYQPLVEKHEVVIGDKIWVLSPKDQVRKCTVVHLKSDAVQVEYPKDDPDDPDPEWIEKIDARILSQADVISKDEELVRTVDEILGKIQFLMQGKVKQSDPTLSCTCCLPISNLFVKKEDVDLVKEVEELYDQCRWGSAKYEELQRTQARAREEGRGEIVDRIAEQFQTIADDRRGGKIARWKEGEDLKQACPRGAQESNYTKHLSLSWCLSNLSCFEKVTRIVKSLVIVACLASLDVIGDVATTKLYKDLNKALQHKDLEEITLNFSTSKFADSTLQALADTLKQCSSLTEDNTDLRLPNSDTGEDDDMAKRIFVRD